MCVFSFLSDNELKLTDLTLTDQTPGLPGFNKSVPGLIPRWWTMCLPHSTPLLTSVNGRLAHNKSLSSKGPSLAKNEPLVGPVLYLLRIFSPSCSD